MILERHRGAVAMHALLQGLLVLLGFCAWYFFVEVVLDRQLVGGFEGYLLYGSLVTAALLLRASYKVESDALQLSGNFRGRLSLAGRQTLFAGFALSVFLVATKDKDISRLFLFSWVPVLYATLAATNMAMPHLLLGLVFSKNNRQRFLLATRRERPSQPDRVVHWIQRQQRMGISVIGVVGPSPIDVPGSVIERLGEIEQLEEIFQSQKADVLMWLEPPGDQEELSRLLNFVESHGARLIFWDDLETRFGTRAWNAEVDGLNFVHFRKEPLQSPLNRGIKRFFDLLVAGTAVVVVMPWLIPIVWIFQKFQSPGPVFFRQKRAGLAGQEFAIFKFRTMHVHGEEESRQATQGDNRIYRFGGWLRKTSLDEMPQFFNVLLGHMSVVGPRPHLSEHNNQWRRLLNAYNVRAVVKPGITGLAQVRGMRGEARTDQDVLNRIESDLEYIENYSPVIDLAIVLQTAWQVLFPKNSAY